jgi:uncharacterized membrane protein
MPKQVLAHPPSTDGGRLATIVRLAKDGAVWITADGRERQAQVVMHVPRTMLRTALRRKLPVVIAEIVGADHPVITGVLSDAAPLQATVDGRQVEITGEREVVLRCGKASITLTRAGQIVLRGEFITSQANGPQVIRGKTVDIN